MAGWRAALSTRSNRARRATLLLASALALGLGACSRSESTAQDSKTTAAGEPKYPLTGEVLRVDAAEKSVRVRHDEIEGYMPAMTMDFSVAPADLAVLKAGDKIRAQLIQGKDGTFRLEQIWPNDKVSVDTVEASTKQLRQDTHSRGRQVYREVGETVPDFALYDQTGRVVQMNRFRGKKIALNFIYTRCPIATMCPAATQKMMQVQQLARESGVENLELVSITLDPEYDTPAILREYAEARGIDTANFSFLTGPQSAIKDLLAQFGVLSVFEGDLIKHTLTTLLIDENGKIIDRADGSQWDPKDFVAKMRKKA